MRFYIKETEKYYNCQLDFWNGILGRWDPECLWEFEGEHYDYNDDLEAYEITQEDFNQLCTWWAEQVRYVNAGGESDLEPPGPMTDHERETGSEWFFTIYPEESENS